MPEYIAGDFEPAEIKTLMDESRSFCILLSLNQQLMVDANSFISQENWAGFPPGNRRNKHRLFYSWALIRFSHHNRHNEYQVDIFPASSEKRGIQSIKSGILSLLEQNRLFDFNYAPQNFDFLMIESVKDADEYLNLLFVNGQWEEEIFAFTKRDYFDVYVPYKNGYVEIV